MKSIHQIYSNNLTMKLSIFELWSSLDFEFDSNFGILEYAGSSELLLSKSDSKLIALSFWYGAKKRSLSSINEWMSILSLRWVLINSTMSSSFVNIFCPFLKQKVSSVDIVNILSASFLESLERDDKVICKVDSRVAVPESWLHWVCCFLHELRINVEIFRLL